LSGNNLSQEIKEFSTKFWKNNSTLETLNLNKCFISKKFLEEISLGIANNYGLKTLILSNNEIEVD